MRISRTFRQRWKHKLTKNHDNDSFYGNETTFYITLFILTNGGDFHQIFAARVPLIFTCAVCYTHQKHEDFSSMHRSLILTVPPHSGPFTKFLSEVEKKQVEIFSHNPWLHGHKYYYHQNNMLCAYNRAYERTKSRQRFVSAEQNYSIINNK